MTLFLLLGKKSKETSVEWNEIISQVKKYIFTKFITSSATGILAGLIYWALGIELAFIFGSLTFLIPRLFEVNMLQISNDVAITGLLAGLVYAIASFSQIGTGWLVDKIPPKYVLAAMGLGQLIFIYIASQSSDFGLLFIMLAAMIFVFGQVPITDVILVKYVKDSWRGRVLSIKFMVNLSAGASVLPITSLLLKNGYNFSFVLQCLAFISISVIIAGMLLPNKSPTFKVA